MRTVILLVVSALAATAMAGPIEGAREHLRRGDADEAAAAVELLVSTDSADAVKALEQGTATVLRRLKREADALDRITEERNRVLSTIIERSSRLVKLVADGRVPPEVAALRKEIDRAKAKDAQIAPQQAAAADKVAATEAIVMIALPAFRRFRSDDAVGAIETCAAGKRGRISRACTEALVCIGAERSLPVLAKLARGNDPARRALATRGLKLTAEAVTPELTANLTDKVWPVRHAAYEAIARGPVPIAVPTLIEARTTAPDADLPRIDTYLWRLTGVFAAGAPEWQAWWEKNAAAVRDGTLPRPPGGPPPGGDPAGLGAALASRRVALVLALGAPPPDSPAKRSGGSEPDLFASLREELKRTVAAVPDGATFCIVSYYASRDPVPASEGTRREAVAWLDGLKRQPAVRLPMTLTRFLITESELLGEADTVLLVSASKGDFGPAAADHLAAKVGEQTTGPVVHCLGVGNTCDEDVLACVALQTGGAFIGGKTPLYAKIPAPGADAWSAGRARVAFWRALRRQDGQRDALAALAAFGEEAYPLLPSIVACLEADRPEGVRAQALATLGAMGPWAREAVPRVKECAEDASPVVAEAAQAALVRITGG